MLRSSNIFMKGSSFVLRQLVQTSILMPMNSGMSRQRFASATRNSGGLSGLRKQKPRQWSK